MCLTKYDNVVYCHLAPAGGVRFRRCIIRFCSSSPSLKEISTKPDQLRSVLHFAFKIGIHRNKLSKMAVNDTHPKPC